MAHDTNVENADAELRDDESGSAQGESCGVSDEQSLLLARFGNGGDFDTLTVGQLAEMLEELQRMMASVGALLQSRLRPGDGLDSDMAAAFGAAEDVSPAEIERLAGMLDHIETHRVA